MKIELIKVTVGDLVEGYVDDEEEGVVAYGGRLDVRPPYQREFVYKPDQQVAVVATIMRGYPLNVMYWNVRGDGHYEVVDVGRRLEILDGQQRTLSICRFRDNKFCYTPDGQEHPMFFDNLKPEEQRRFLSYELTVYVCQGTDRERIEWFRTINIAGAELTEQEIRNAVYAGPWCSSAKRYFSKTAGPAYNRAHDLLAGSANRQDYLETVLSWKAAQEGLPGPDAIEQYMAAHQHDADATPLIDYFEAVWKWVRATFTKPRKEMKGVAWGPLHDAYGGSPADPAELEKQIKALMADSDVTRKAGIYRYVFSGDPHDLEIRAFDANMRREAYERQQGRCATCGKHFALEEMDADHITPWAGGGHTVAANCQMLCKECNRRKGKK